MGIRFTKVNYGHILYRPHRNFVGELEHFVICSSLEHYQSNYDTNKVWAVGISRHNYNSNSEIFLFKIKYSIRTPNE